MKRRKPVLETIVERSARTKRSATTHPGKRGKSLRDPHNRDMTRRKK